MTVLTDPGRGRAAAAATPETKGGRWIDHWEPDDEGFWARTGRRVAARNLVFSILTEHLGFCVWLLWSIAVLNLNSVGMQLSVGQVLWLTTLPNLVGAAMRIPYTFAPARFGGRNWTIVSALLLVVPCGLFVYAIENPDIPYWALLVIAATTGLGGGNFASSMANITHFYPADRQGLPLGLNAAGGNLGTSVTQLAMPPLIVAFGLVAVGWVWMPFILLAAVCAYFFMNNLRQATSAYTLREMGAICRQPQTVVMSVLYIGTFGSFIGYSFSFGVLIKSQFPDIKGADFIWLGAFAGSLARPLGGWLADRFGGARVTAVDFLLMAAGIGAVAAAVRAGSWPLFLAAFLLVFVTTGIGNGSTYKMIPAIFKTKALERVDTADPAAVARAMATARRNAAAAIGITSSVGAFGGVLIQQSFRISLEETSGIGPALVGLTVFYGLCMLLTWAVYLRKVRVGDTRTSLAQAGV
ncbi:MFS transporter, NNP family, nitrate/nitrite transporter [Thermomonospora echinospora]|uniref:MFS transporter, NNP family, nitrate/nitrite transporter n=1 Tax=Thermomonospora echinospora TaxID=1992 RepID=A0A1H6D9K6_9ACTN|nr:nitrate/nitrite transporter [Thermomonospora echinospora]SEG81503.1 MFS transporter, NNP family, nitrate/nitrite transporter [Thermomonospora echinospora]